MDIVNKYFPDLSALQTEQFTQLFPLYALWNSRINVISRKDIDRLYERHVLHSLSIAKIIKFKKNTKIIDVGTGGGFPGIPLAILFPESKFHLVDSIAKKIKVVATVAEELNLQNVSFEQSRAEELKGKYDFIISRAVTTIPEFYAWVSGLISKNSFNELPNGILYIKGGDFTDELKSIRKKYSIYPISDYFEEPFFETKGVVHIVKNA
jgi:16S rRNA (guanine527-N7)-methyltransferase